MRDRLLRYASLTLLREADFRQLWAAQTVSMVGSGISGVALPLAAILLLDPSPLEMGLLRAAGTAPALLFSLLVGVWVDRLRRRPIMVAADVGRALLLGVVPLAAAVGTLRIDLLYTVAFLAGVLTVLFDVAATSYTPALVGRARLVEGNAALQVGRSTAGIAGPGLAGGLVSLVGAPYAVAADALSFLASAAMLARIGAPESPPPARERGRLGREIAEGLGVVWNDRVLRPLTVGTAVASLGGSVQGAVFVLFAVQELGIGPVPLGLVFAAAGATALVGGLLAAPAARSAGAGPALLWAQAATVAGSAVLALGGIVPGSDALLLGSGQALFGAGMSVFSITQISLRQAITAPHLLGRVNATRRVLVFGIQPIGALIGGLLGDAVGLRPALVAGAAIQLVALIICARSPLRVLKTAG
jgi:MFS family permease